MAPRSSHSQDEHTPNYPTNFCLHSTLLPAQCDRFAFPLFAVSSLSQQGSYDHRRFAFRVQSRLMRQDKWMVAAYNPNMYAQHFIALNASVAIYHLSRKTPSRDRKARSARGCEMRFYTPGDGLMQRQETDPIPHEPAEPGDGNCFSRRIRRLCRGLAAF